MTGDKKQRYEKPVAKELNDLTPVSGLCSSGGEDGGCTNGGDAGGTEGCSNGTYAAPPGCSQGANAFQDCGNGTAVY